MKLSIFSRLVSSYLTIFFLMIALGLYVTSELRYFEQTMRSILDTDNRLIDLQQKMADALLSHVLFGRKYLITKDESLYAQAAVSRKEFEQNFARASAIADARAMDLLQRANSQFQVYWKLFEAEARLAKENEPYPQEQHKARQDKAVDEVLGTLEQLKAQSQASVYAKLRDMAESGGQTQRVNLLVTSGSLVFLILVSVLITRSIVHPIAVLHRKTRQIAGGNFEGDLRVSSPPEIAELAAAFNFMCDKLKELDMIKSDFFSSMSHELRTPLTSMKEGISLLLDRVGGETSEKQRRLLTILAEESNRLIGVVNSLLDLSKMEAGMMTYDFEESAVSPLIRKAVAEIAPLVEAKRIEMETLLEDPLPPVKLDRERILQVLRNLIGNAVKFSAPAGRIRISGRLVDHQIKVAVEDSGPGIPPENLTRIFDKFHQAAHPGGGSVKGTGLGLAIAQHIVQSHGGTIWAESETGSGSTFTFVLPV